MQRGEWRGGGPELVFRAWCGRRTRTPSAELPWWVGRGTRAFPHPGWGPLAASVLAAGCGPQLDRLPHPIPGHGGSLGLACVPSGTGSEPESVGPAAPLAEGRGRRLFSSPRGTAARLPAWSAGQSPRLERPQTGAGLSSRSGCQALSCPEAGRLLPILKSSNLSAEGGE